MWFVSRRRFNSEIAALRGYADAMRERCELAEGNVRTERVARQTITRQHADLDEQLTATRIVNACLTEDLSKLREELAEARAQASDSLAGQLRAELKREKKRADHLQKRLDDATGLNTGRGDVGLHDSEHWKPPISLDAKPGVTS